jgi:hypothetical protein
MSSLEHTGRLGPPYPFAVILGTNEIASAVAVYLHRAGYRVVLSHDPVPPVIRRKMAFHDALFDEPSSSTALGRSALTRALRFARVLMELAVSSSQSSGY